MMSTLRILLSLLLIALISGCATYQQPRYGHDGVYYEQPVSRHSTSVVRVDPLLYPYWSLDYFYFSRHYHPYSFWVGAYDPWFYPYPGWYYGYRPSARTRVGLSYHAGWFYPWYGFGYRWHQPWGWSYVYYPAKTSPPPSRVRHVDERLRMLEDRQRHSRQASAVQGVGPTTHGMISTQRQSRIQRQGHDESWIQSREALRERQRATIRPGQTRPAQDRQRPTARPGTSTPRREPTRSQPRRDPAPAARPDRPARTQPTAPPRSQMPARPARPAPPVRSQPAEPRRPPRSRGREEEP